MWFGYNPQNIFVTFLQVELSHISSIIYNKVNGQGIPCGRNSSYNFIPILSKLHWCFGHGLNIYKIASSRCKRVKLNTHEKMQGGLLVGLEVLYFA